MIGHWLNVHLWGPMWPNVFAPSAFTLAAVLASHLRTRLQIRAGHQATTAAVRDQLAEHRKQLTEQLAAHCADIKQHISAVADAPGRAGPGSNPGQSEGLPADPPLGGERVVPPAATARKSRR